MSGEKLNNNNSFEDNEHYDETQAILNQEETNSSENQEKPAKGSSIYKSLEEYSGDLEKLEWKGNFEQYFEMAIEDPRITQSSQERVYGALTERDDFFTTGDHALYGAEEPTKRFLDVLRAGSEGLEIGKRIILLAGPPGSGKSTLVNGTKRAIERYSRTEQGALYGIKDCPMHEDPMHLIPKEIRNSLDEEHGIDVDGDLCPSCEQKYGENFKNEEALKEVPVERVFLSEKKRIGVGTFEPSDPKTQDASELIGAADYSQIGEHGSASDAEAYRFDGELHVANRGFMEFVEMLKSDERFLYTLLNLVQDRTIKSARFAPTSADEVIVAHTNMAEYDAYTGNPKNEALKDRMFVIEVPYTMQVSEESKIHAKLIGESKLAKRKSVHVNPKTYDMASTFGVLTRMKDGKKYNKMQKLKAYDNQEGAEWSKRDLNEMQSEDPKEGMYGVSPRYIIDSLSLAISKEDKTCLNPMDAIKALQDNLKFHPHTKDLDKTEMDRIVGDIQTAREEFSQQAAHDVKRAFVHSFEEQARSLANNYLDNVEAYMNKGIIVDPDTGQEYEPDERLMRSIEERAKIQESGKDEYRREMIEKIGLQALKGEKFDYTKLPTLKDAIQNKLFHDMEDVISLTTSTRVPDEDQKDRIHGVQKTMIEEQGYCQDCAHATIQHVGNEMSRAKSYNS